MANGTQTSAGVGAKEQKRKSCLFWGCLSVVILLVVLTAVLVFGIFSMKRWAMKVTDETQAPLPAENVTRTEQEVAHKNFQDVMNALQEGKAEKFTFTDSHINNIITTVPDFEILRDKVRFEIKDDVLLADARIPLDQIPGMQGRYLNGELELDVNYENGLLQVYATDIRVKGEQVPKTFIKQFSKQNLAQNVYQNKDAMEALKHIEEIRVENGRLILVTRETANKTGTE